MTSGFRVTLDGVLRKFGMWGNGILGTVVHSSATRKTLKELGYRVDRGLGKSNYDFIYLSKSKSTVENILTALTKVDNGCIVIFRMDSLLRVRLLNAFGMLGKFYMYEFEPNKFIGVILKGVIK